MTIAHVLINDEWYYLECEKVGFDWVRLDTKEVIDRKLIYWIE